ncbi:MAG TPA: DUF2844 domain-containing protein [Duganella sp.]|uniref:DUF2844 domain-containing protein n=1 Tax=Duganella sp. TaxID=1904440 RepID=UPI002ED68088
MRHAIALMLFLTLLQGALAYAALGGAPSDFGGAATVSARRFAAGAAGTNSTSSTNSGTDAVYTVSQSTLDSGTVVREYSDAAGKVFAVSWRGPTLPDLRTLLGDKFAVMTGAAAKRAQAGHSQLALERADVVLVSTGHMRAFAGHAWLPGALPPGFDTATIE